MNIGNLIGYEMSSNHIVTISSSTGDLSFNGLKRSLEGFYCMDSRTEIFISNILHNIILSLL